jgi:hypothetical protein
MKDAILYDQTATVQPGSEPELIFKILNIDIYPDEHPHYDSDEDFMERYNDDDAYYGAEMRSSPGKRHINPQKAPQQPSPGSQEQNQYR